MSVDAALRAMAHPARRTILRLVWHDERTSSDLSDRLGMSRPATSQHLRVLREADLVAVRVDANRRWYRADRARMAEVRDLVDAFWADRLDALQVAAERVSAERDAEMAAERHAEMAAARDAEAAAGAGDG